MGDFHIIYILSQRGAPNFEHGIEDLPYEGDESWHSPNHQVSDLYLSAMVTTCWGFLCYCKEGEEDLFKSDWAKCIQGRYYLPAQLLQHLNDYVRNDFTHGIFGVWHELLNTGYSQFMFLDNPDELHFCLDKDGTVSISYYIGHERLIRRYTGISLENLREEFYRFGKSLLEGYVFKVRPDLRKHPDFAKLAEDLEAMMETDF